MIYVFPCIGNAFCLFLRKGNLESRSLLSILYTSGKKPHTYKLLVQSSPQYLPFAIV